jgi:hypothetical protein
VSGRREELIQQLAHALRVFGRGTVLGSSVSSITQACSGGAWWSRRTLWREKTELPNTVPNRTAGVEELIVLQPDGAHAKPYQVRQVRGIVLRYGLGDAP